MSVQEDALYSIICCLQVLEIHTEACFFRPLASSWSCAGAEASRAKQALSDTALGQLAAATLFSSCMHRAEYLHANDFSSRVHNQHYNISGRLVATGMKTRSLSLVGTLIRAVPRVPNLPATARRTAPGCSHMSKYKSSLISHSQAPPCVFLPQPLPFFGNCLGALHQWLKDTVQGGAAQLQQPAHVGRKKRRGWGVRRVA